MASKILMIQVLFALLSLAVVSAGRVLLTASKADDNNMLFRYHNGRLLTGKISVNLIWYGNFQPSQKAIISDFIASLVSSSSSQSQPSVAIWWNNIRKYYYTTPIQASPTQLSLGPQTIDENYSLGNSLKIQQIEQLAAKTAAPNSISVVLTSSDVAVEGFCSSRCGTHGSLPASSSSSSSSKSAAYIWVGNSETQCPGQCAWPFHPPIYGPQAPPLVAPNNDVGLDGMVMTLASLLAGTVTNPFGSGYYQGPAAAPLEASSACPGVYGKDAYPGYPGQLLVDPTTGASFDACGTSGRKYLLPALYDPSTSSCSTLV